MKSRSFCLLLSNGSAASGKSFAHGGSCHRFGDVLLYSSVVCLAFCQGANRLVEYTDAGMRTLKSLVTDLKACRYLPEACALILIGSYSL
jgi:hypothetical protein